MVYTNGVWVVRFSAHHFQRFFPVYRHALQNIVNTTCAEAYSNYRDHNATCTPDILQFGWNLNGAQCSGYEIVNCILGQLPETAKSDMMAAGIFLGLLPVILSMASPSLAEFGILALRRPLLASILALACPAANPVKGSEYQDPLEVLCERSKHVNPNAVFSRSPRMKSFIQYLLALGALVNLILVAVDLTDKVIFGGDVNRDYQVAAWSLWAFALHISGAIALALCVKLETQLPFGQGMSLRARIEHEFATCATQPSGTIRLRRQTYTFITLAWATSIATIVHIAYGTQVFSGLLFLSGGEGMQILVRCLASVVLCRMILMYELNGLGQVLIVEREEQEQHPTTPSTTTYVIHPATKVPEVSDAGITYSRLSPRSGSP